MTTPHVNRRKIAEKIAGCDVTDSKAVSDLLLQNREEIIKALLRPPAVAGPVQVETIEQVVYHHFYPGPLSGSTTRLANALLDAFPALQGHEA